MPPVTGDATIHIVTEILHDRHGDIYSPSGITGVRYFIVITKKNSLYGLYENLPNFAHSTTDAAIVNTSVKIPGNDQKYPIAIDKSTRQYTSDGVRYYLSGELPEPLRRPLTEESHKPVDVLTVMYRGAVNGSRYMESRSAGLLINWHHPV